MHAYTCRCQHLTAQYLVVSDSIEKLMMKITEDQANSIIDRLKVERAKSWQAINYELQDDAEVLFIRIYLDDATVVKNLGKPVATRICSEAIPERKDGPLYSWMVAFIYKGEVIDSTMGGGSNGII
jgi:hypothetical protein